MARPGPANDEERLPWLEPYRDSKTVARPPRSKRKSRGGMLAAVAAAAVLVAAGGGYILGQRKPAPVIPTAEVALKTLPAPVASPPVASPEVVPPAAAPVVAAPPTIAKVERRPAARVAQAAPRQAQRSSARQRKIRSAGIESAQIRAVRAAQEARPVVTPPVPSPPRTAYRAWPKMPSPGPAGQVIQLGAFKNPARAKDALRRRLARYPALGRMPRVVVPVITRPRGQILYVLRLGTTSRQQSATVCKNLRASGDHCLVIG